MSISEFCAEYRPSEGLWEIVNSRRRYEQGRGHVGSIVQALALTYIEQGARGVGDFAKKHMGAESLITHIHPRTFDKYPEAAREELIADFAAVFLGATIATIEDALIQGSIDLGVFGTRFNTAIAGKPFRAIEIPKPSIIPVAPLDARKMRQYAQEEDRTLAGFLDSTGKDMLPEQMRKFLITFPLYIPACGLLPGYRKQAEYLITRPQ